MTGASSLAYPGGKTLAGWWRQLQGYAPHAVWAGYLFVHRIEALVQAMQQKPLDRLAQLVLESLHLQPTGPPLLPLGEALTGQLLRGLGQEGLVERPDAQWILTESGQQALATGHYAATVQERRVFSFVERVDGACQRQSLPVYLPLGPGPGVPWPAQEPYRVDVAWLRDGLAHDDAWKSKVGFPTDVQALLESNWSANGTADTTSPLWRRVIIDRPERLLLVFAASGANPEIILGFAVKPEGWGLNTHDPILRLPHATAAEILPSLARLPDAAWKTAWSAWCGTRHLPAEDIHASKVTVDGPRLKVVAPAALIQRLRAARSEVFKGETWLLAGEGHIRAAAMVEVAEG